MPAQATIFSFYLCHQCKECPCDKLENSELADVIPAQVKNSVLRVMKRFIPLRQAKVAEHGTEKGSLNGLRPKVNATIVPPAANRSTEVPNIAGRAKLR